MLYGTFLQVTRGACNPNLQVVIAHALHASHVYTQPSFGLPLTMDGMQRTQFDHVHLDLLAVVI